MLGSWNVWEESASRNFMGIIDHVFCFKFIIFLIIKLLEEIDICKLVLIKMLLCKTKR